jgi:hypothetical protein
LTIIHRTRLGQYEVPVQTLIVAPDDDEDDLDDADGDEDEDEDDEDEDKEGEDPPGWSD